MRPPLIALVAAAFVLACADVPTAPLVQPPDGALGSAGKAPPPWAEVSGDISEDGSAAQSIAPLMSVAFGSGARATHAPTGSPGTYLGWLLVTPGDRTAWLRFTGGTNVTFSPGARIMKVGDRVSGTGTVTLNGHTYQLSTVTTFEYSRDCTNPVPTDGASCGSFSGEGFSSSGSTWTGRLANDGGGDFDFPPGWGDCKRTDCFCINCVDAISVTNGRGR